MDAAQFNQACRNLRRDRMILIRLADGRTIEGFFLNRIKAGVREGSIELDTRNGSARFPSSAIESIESVGSDIC
jgi:hypothetical protein